MVKRAVHYVNVNEASSEAAEVTRGEKQGSKLGVFIFICINYLPQQVKHFEPFGYADN